MMIPTIPSIDFRIVLYIEKVVFKFLNFTNSPLQRELYLKMLYSVVGVGGIEPIFKNLVDYGIPFPSFMIFHSPQTHIMIVR